jgi:hypothetical protein
LQGSCNVDSDIWTTRAIKSSAMLGWGATMGRKHVGYGDDSVWLTAMTFRANENMVGAAMDTRGN